MDLIALNIQRGRDVNMHFEMIVDVDGRLKNDLSLARTTAI